ncbi:hypothetical protein Tco_0706396 [Tanacetum coccineum]|uniref:Integrase, catalytic region, zinc finger, CCHC-type, peptidase aspartic, catalytic n=1 Tax=Tanacetum coccineum TaxID=301880 RepID=A0ABQ4Y998_9ASTR
MVETYSRGRQTTTPEPAWVIPTSHILDAVNNWANALCLPHNKARRELLYLKRLGISGPYELYSKRWERPKLTTNRFGWSSYEVIKAFYPDIVHLQFQMEDTQAAEITLRRADYQEYTIAEKDFKNLYPSDFEDLNLLLLQGTIRDPIAEGKNGAQQLGPERAQVYSDLSSKDKDRYNADIRATNILLQGLPKYIYTLINHYTEAKDIWDNVKMLLDGSELMKEDQESQLYDDFEHFCQNKGETIHDCYVWFAKLINDMRNIKMTMSRMQLNSKTKLQFKTVGLLCRMFRVDRIEVRGTIHELQVQLVMGELRTELGMQIQVKQDRLSDTTAMNRVALDEEQLLFIAGGQDTTVDEDVDKQPVQDLALNMHNMFQADDYDAFDSDVDEAPNTQTMFMANLSTAYPVYDEAGPSYDSDILSENNVVVNSLIVELATYKEQVELYEIRAKFELTEREQKINEQLRIVIADRNRKEENLKRELHSVKL